jgi:hypothetical protein
MLLLNVVRTLHACGAIDSDFRRVPCSLHYKAAELVRGDWARHSSAADRTSSVIGPVSMHDNCGLSSAAFIEIAAAGIAA